MKRFAHWSGGAVKALLAALVVLTAGGASRAHAQFAEAPAAAREVPAEQTINLFARWDGETPIDGFYAGLPPGWRLEAATALQNGGTRRVPLSTRPTSSEEQGDDTYFIGAAKTLRGPVEVVLRVRTGAARGGTTEEWTLVPFTYRSDQRLHRLRARRIERQVKVKETATTEDNRVLAFRNGAAPLLLDRARLPSLSTRASFTVETWLKTTRLGEVVLSTWDGAEQHPYPLELVIGTGGRLRYYRGRRGRHESMTSPSPVADGTWHHVAVTHDPEAGRTRLLLDGVAVDSLRGTVPLEPGRKVVALGGRVPPRRSEKPEASDSTAQGERFTGELDEVHFWPQARTPGAVRRTMRQPHRADAPGQEQETRRLNTDEPGAVLLSFESNGEWPSLVTRDPPQGVRRVRSKGLRFYAPITGLRARPERQPGTAESQPGAVALSWAAPDRGTFVIERSSDGKHFRTVGRREARPGRRRYTFTDAEATGDVVFYRIRQQFESGAERVSGTLKVGRGATERKEEGVTLMGNFPNPFSDETTIAYQVHGEETHVRVAVWDLTGQRVAILLDKSQTPGYKEVPFRPENLSSGTYFVRLRAGGKTYTHKMALVK